MRVLQSRLLLLQREQEAATKKEFAGNITASWGDQMRSYVLAPYQMVKDLRTDYEVNNPEQRVRRRPRRLHRRRHPLAQAGAAGLTAVALRRSRRVGYVAVANPDACLGSTGHDPLRSRHQAISRDDPSLP